MPMFFFYPWTLLRIELVLLNLKRNQYQSEKEICYEMIIKLQK